METVLAERPVSSLPSGKEVTALQHVLRELYEEIADYLDDDQVERLPDYFVDDCMYKVVSKENYDQGLPQAAIFCDGIAMIHDRILALRETQVHEQRALRHFISGVRVTAIEGDGVRARANFLVTEAMSDAEPRVLMVGRYIDRLVQRGSRWLFKERLAVYDNYRVYRSLIVPV